MKNFSLLLCFSLCITAETLAQDLERVIRDIPQATPVHDTSPNVHNQDIDQLTRNKRSIIENLGNILVYSNDRYDNFREHLTNLVGDVASQNILLALTEARNRKLSSNYGKRLSVFLKKGGGHQAWFSNYGKRGVSKITPTLPVSGQAVGDLSKVNETITHSLSSILHKLNNTITIGDLASWLANHYRILQGDLSKLKKFTQIETNSRRSDHQARFADYEKRKEGDTNNRPTWPLYDNTQTTIDTTGHSVWFSGKRTKDVHQAWFSGYGKRDNMASKRHQTQISAYNLGNHIDTRAHQAWFAGYGKKKNIDTQGHQAWFAGYGKKNDMDKRGHQAWFAGYGKRNDKAKRGHQAWFAGYGKRNDMDKRGHQAWFAGYGKRNDMDKRGHQAWFAGYGKRNDMDKRGHQAWFAGYGKRSDADNGGHPGWFSGYGKKSDVDTRGHQAWFSGYGKRTGINSHDTKVLSSDYGKLQPVNFIKTLPNQLLNRMHVLTKNQKSNVV